VIDRPMHVEQERTGAQALHHTVVCTLTQQGLVAPTLMLHTAGLQRGRAHHHRGDGVIHGMQRMKSMTRVIQELYDGSFQGL